MTCPLADVINGAKFYLNRVHGFWFCGGSNFWLSHKKEKSPLTQGLNYRSACYVLFGWYFRQKEQEENPSAVLGALKTYYLNLPSVKSQKYFVDTSSSSSNSINDESEIRLDDRQTAADSLETTSAVSQHSQVSMQPLELAVDDETTASTNVSIAIGITYRLRSICAFCNIYHI